MVFIHKNTIWDFSDTIWEKKEQEERKKTRWLKENKSFFVHLHLKSEEAAHKWARQT